MDSSLNNIPADQSEYNRLLAKIIIQCISPPLKEHEMRACQITPRSSKRNHHRQDMKDLWCQLPNYTNITQWCLEDVLGLSDYKLNVKWCVFLDPTLGEFIPPDTIHISQDLSGFDPLRVLFHEIRHYHQFKTGKYNFIRTPYITKLPDDSPLKLKHSQQYLDYQNYPWEIDARDFAIETYNRFWKESVSNFHKHNPAPERR